MKKKLLLLVIAFMQINFASVKAQTYYPYVDTNKLWSTYYDLSGEGLPSFSYYVKFTQDTTIKTKTYKKVMRSDDSSHVTWYNYGYIRETSNKKVYYLANITDTIERFFYDFNVDVGDTLPLFYCPLHVDSIDSILVGNQYRKRFNLGIDTWIEGIGSLSGFSSIGVCFVGGKLYLLCFTENDTIKYINPLLNFCYQGTVNINELKKDNFYFEIFPNPSNGVFKIQANACINGSVHIEVMNYSGQIISHKNINLYDTYQIDLSTYRKGLYLIHIKGNSFSISKKVIVQ